MGYYVIWMMCLSSNAEHDKRLMEALSQLQKAGVILDPSKCKFNCKSVSFLRYVIDKSGIRADPCETSAIL